VDGFLNARNPSIPALFQRGLMLHPPLRLMSEQFRKFVFETGARENVTALQKEEQPSLWQKMKWPFLVVLVAVATFLFFSQRQVFEIGIGYLGALGGAVTALFKLLDVLRDPRRER